ncbi:MAG: 2Fe-2S iron-sulfur cluster binding domain-containing protein [Verrucomicrobia bacterium]|nr:2Fe-2S iron-sulfur cluster binding domain-containing protein [Verrucomicrobiota bacterium]
MIAPKKISITINGQVCEGEQGQTILEIARANNIYIPTLCYMKGLTPWGGCRLCIVEVEGNPKVVPSCATPAVDGTKITTHNDRLVALRKATLELLFSERNHICPICPYNKGDCGLQHQGLAHGITGIRYPYLYPALPVDVTGRYFGIDHNRCILCTRCIRTCDEIEGVHTLDVSSRGIKNQIVVDMNTTFGASDTCTQCGACVVSCPTGALFDKAAAFRGQWTSSVQILTTCTECPVGCGLKVHTKENRIVNVWGDPDSPVNTGHLCVKGRYQTWAEPRDRITTPLIKGQPATWDEALAAIKKAAKVKKAEKALLVAPRVTNETAAAIAGVAGKFGQTAMFVGANEAALCAEPSFTGDALRKLQDADAIIVLGAQPTRDNGVVASRIRVAVRKRGAKLLIFHARKSELDRHADVAANVVSLESKLWNKVKAALAGAQRPAIVYGPNAMTPIGVTVMERLIAIFEANTGGSEPLLIGLPVSANALAMSRAGIPAVEEVGPWLDAKPLKFLHIVVGDALDGGAGLLEEKYVPALLERIDCLVVQASYKSALTDKASVVLPATIWCEKTGTVTNLEGRELPLRPVVTVAGEARDDKAILESVYA